MHQKASFLGIQYITCLYYQLRIPKSFTETKTNIKSRIVERTKKDIFEIIEIFIVY